MANVHAGGNGSHYFLNTHRDIQKENQFLVKETKEYNTPGGFWVCLYPIVVTLVLPTEISCDSKTGKQAVIDRSDSSHRFI